MVISFFRKYRKNSLSVGLLMLSPILVFFLPFKLYWLYHLLILLFVIIENKGIARTRYYPLLLFFIFPIIWGFIYSAYLSDSIYSISQSFYYLLIPPIFVAIGMQYGKTISKENILRYVVYSGTAGTIVYIVYGLIILGISNFTGIESIRNVIIWGAIMSVFSVIILLFSSQEKIDIVKKETHKHFLLFINSAGVLLTASRTYYLIFLVLLLLFLLNYHRRWFLIFSVALIIIFIQLLNIETNNFFIIKIQNSFVELFEDTQYAGYNTANEYYRSYESTMAFDTYKTGNDIEFIFGHGLEKQVDLKQYILLGEIFRKEIPITHNGYPYMLIRFGILGVISYFFFFLRTFFIGFRKRKFKFFHILSIGISLSLIMSNYVIYGFFNLEIAMIWALLGALIVFQEKKSE